MSGIAPTPVTSGSGGPGQATFEAQMQQMEAQSREDSLIEMQANVAINQNNSAAQTSQGIGHE